MIVACAPPGRHCATHELCAGALWGDSFLTREVAMTIVLIRGLFEAHLTVSDLDRSIRGTA
jgi:hypothetical protein